MKKLVVCLVMMAVAMISSAEMIIYTADGREFKVQVEAREITRIEFTGSVVVSKPEAPKADPAASFIGLWQRSEKNKVVEYMEIRNNKGTIEVVMGDNPKGPFKSGMPGTVASGRLTGSGPKRKFTMTLSGKDQINYTSEDFSGSNPWSCVWVRSR